MTNERPLLLVCNDDGILAPGIRALVQAAARLGEVWVVAPDSPQSGMGHAISISKPLRVVRLSDQEAPAGIPHFACNGTPADCVKLATGELLPRRPSLIVSGINHGANSSVAVLYSGTMSAAVEGAIEGIPSIGFSLCSFEHNANFQAAAWVAGQVMAEALRQPFPQHVALNVNIPYLPQEQLLGMRITRQSNGHFVEEFERRTDPYGRNYYWLAGQFELRDHGTDTDEWALANGYVSICPVQVDMTAYHAMSSLNQWELPSAFRTESPAAVPPPAFNELG